eukprot:m.223474 g.223474  ORF g.223474 m.223474 type:complete len:491 (-) comp16256_c0_seq1:1326-2798(-)
MKWGKGGLSRCLLELGDALLEGGDLGAVLGLLGRAQLHCPHTRGKLQRAHCLWCVLDDGRDLHNHERLRSAAQRVLQQMSQLRVAVRNVLLLCPERVNDITQRRERLVDVGGLTQTVLVVKGATLCHALRASQVDQIQLALGLDTSAEVGAGDGHHQQRVRPTRHVVHLGRGGRTALLRLLKLLAHFLSTAHRVGGEAGHKGAILAVLDIQLELGIVGKEIADVFVVDFNDTDLHLKGPVDLALLEHGEQLGEGTAVEAGVGVVALHREGLARASLAIGEDAHVEAVGNRHNEIAHSSKHIVLLAVHLEHVVQLELVDLALVLDVQDLIVVAIEVDDNLGVLPAAVLGDDGADTTKDTDVALEIDQLVVQLLAQGHFLAVLVHHFLVLRVHLRQRPQQISLALLDGRGNLALQIAGLLLELLVVLCQPLDGGHHRLDLAGKGIEALLQILHAVLGALLGLGNLRRRVGLGLLQRRHRPLFLLLQLRSRLA